MSDSN